MNWLKNWRLKFNEKKENEIELKKLNFFYLDIQNIWREIKFSWFDSFSLVQEDEEEEEDVKEGAEDKIAMNLNISNEKSSLRTLLPSHLLLILMIIICIAFNSRLVIFPTITMVDRVFTLTSLLCLGESEFQIIISVECPVLVILNSLPFTDCPNRIVMRRMSFNWKCRVKEIGIIWVITGWWI